jgi:hypothetical protein
VNTSAAPAPAPSSGRQLTPYQARSACAASPYGILAYDEFVSAAVNDELRAIIVNAEARTRQSVGSKNVGGWKSTDTLLTWPDEAIGELHDTLAAMVGGRITGWAMINRDGSYHQRHNHRSILSGVYYVDPGDPAILSSPTIFETGGREISVRPVPRRLVIFSSSIFHRVPPYHSTEPRISIAFDVR